MKTMAHAEKKLPVTVVIPTKNEGDHLGKCLERLDRFAEIVVIDSESEDDTIKLAEQYGARTLNFVWDGKFPKKRNWFLINSPPHLPWVLFLDADEFINDAFCDLLAATLDDTDKDAFWLNYKNFFLNRPLNHGVPQRKLALFRVGKALYEKIEEDGWSQLDMEIHEHPIVNGKIGEISEPIEHRDYRGLGKFIEKHRDYALWEARRYAKLRDDVGAWSHFTSRQRFKYRNLAKWWYPWFYLTFTYVVKCGFLDGSQGFHYAIYKAWYFQTIRLLIQEHDAQAQRAWDQRKG